MTPVDLAKFCHVDGDLFSTRSCTCVPIPPSMINNRQRWVSYIKTKHSQLKYLPRKVQHIKIVGTRMLALPFRCISSSMDEHALRSGHVSPSGSVEWRARAPTPRPHLSSQPQLSPQRADSADTRLSGEESLHPEYYVASCLLVQGIYR